ncbi:MAG TPA: flagellar basal body P-ring protein FlgI [Sedimenticola sp.]|nr:flagellar basal body P-ring protein FlgI [Sedimenticola sp.]
MSREQTRRPWVFRASGPLPAALLLVLLLGGFSLPLQAERIKDIVTIAGVRSNQLIGYGLVVGLDGTGDKGNAAPYTMQSLKSMLAQMGIVVPPGVKIKPKNVAAVSVHAELHPFAKQGQKIDVTVSSIGDASSLRGGSLLMSPLKGIDGQVYAIAQGELVVGGLSATGADGSKVTVNIPTAGRIPNGATVERTIRSAFSQGNHLTLNLRNGDFTTAQRIVDSINKAVGQGMARAVDATTVNVSAPVDQAQRVSFMSLIENLEVKPASAPARIVVNSRTGTVIISTEVHITPVAVAHGNLTVTISENTQVSQPGPLARAGNTEVVNQSQVNISEEPARMFLLQPGTTLADVVRAVNQVGAAPSDLVAILEALKRSGAMNAELIII